MRMKKRSFAVQGLCLAIAAATAFSTTAVPRRYADVSAAVTQRNTIEAHEQLAQQIAENGMVLLKNEGVLPLKPTDTVAYGNLTPQIFGGSGSSEVYTSRFKTTYDIGLSDAVDAGRIKGLVKGMNKTADKAVYVITRSSAEGGDNTVNSAPIGGDPNKIGGYYLTAAEKKDLEDACAKFGAENVVVILNTGAVVDTSWLIEKNVGAIVAAFYGGNMAGVALANCLTGKSNFSGKTTDTWAKRYEDYPSSGSEDVFGEFGTQGNLEYSEDVYVGYRYFSTFDPNYEKVNYEFGYGLSYTEFMLTEQKISVQNDEVTASVKVTNTGDIAGREVVQLYYHAPDSATVGGQLKYFGNPARELGGFKKTAVLQPGKSETVTISYPLSDMAVFDDLGKIEKDTYQLLAGEYNFYLGTSVKNANNLFAGYAPYRVAETRAVSEKLTPLRNSMLRERLLANGETEHVGGLAVSGYGATVIQGEYFDAKKSQGNNDGDIGSEDATLGLGAFPYVGWMNTTGEWVEYNLSVERAGAYGLGMAVALDDANAHNDCLEVYVDGVRQNVVFNYTGAGDWTLFNYATATGTLDLPEGEVTIRLQNKGGLGNIDYFILYNHEISPDGATVIEAETGSGIEAVSAGNTAATKQSNASGNFFEYPVNVTAVGEYQVRLYASNVNNASEHSMKLYVGGEEKGEFSLMKTSFRGEGAELQNDFIFGYTNSVTVALPAGQSTIRIATLDDSLCSLDRIEIAPAAADAPEYVFRDNSAEIGAAEDKNVSTGVDFNMVRNDQNSIDSFVGQLTAKELIAFTGCGYFMPNPGIGGPGGFGGFNNIAFGQDSYNKLLSAKKVPTVYTTDAGAGLRLWSASEVVWFPNGTLIASTWDTTLAERYGMAMGQEAKKFGFGVWLAPAVNIHRNPLCGRNFEYYSEDPLVSGMIGAAATRGSQAESVAVCVKHFVGNEQETTRFTSNSCISNRAFREIYLRAFEIVVKDANPWGLMSSYNRVNGEWVCTTPELLKDLLRGEWGFDGVVFSDWHARRDHAAMINAGNNIKDEGNVDYDLVYRSFVAGTVSRETLEENAKDIIKLMLRVEGRYQEPEKAHTFDTEWTYDETHHWHAATCNHPDLVGDQAEHNFVDGYCTECGFKQPGQPPVEPVTPDKNNEAPIGLIVGLSVGGAVLAVGAALAAVFVVKKKKGK